MRTLENPKKFILPSKSVSCARVLQKLSVVFLVHAGSRMQLRDNHARVHRVHTDVIRSEFQRGASGELVHGGLAHVVSDHARKRSEVERGFGISMTSIVDRTSLVFCKNHNPQKLIEISNDFTSSHRRSTRLRCSPEFSLDAVWRAE